MLLRRPDEFGLVPEGGWYPVKDVLKALAEEGRPVREGHLREINHLAVADGQSSPLIIHSGRLKPSLAAAPEPVLVDEDEAPALLFGFCRRRAHASVLRRGLKPSRGALVVLSRDKALARRMGLRFDSDPVLITVNVESLCDQGLEIRRLGKEVFLCPELPPHLLSLPPLPKERPAKEKPAPEALALGPRLPAPEELPGTFLLRLDPAAEAKFKPRRSKKKWQKERRQERRQRKRV